MAICPACGRPFEPDLIHRVTCSAACSRNRYRPKLRVVTVTCRQCKAEFTGRENRVFCSPGCSRAYHTTYLKGPGHVMADPGVTEHLVYMWFDVGASLPYYAGSGACGREQEPHAGLRNPARVEVVRRGLTAQSARLVEGAVIAALRAVGAPLENVWNPSAAAEVIS